jgi:hypothetical protein
MPASIRQYNPVLGETFFATADGAWMLAEQARPNDVRHVMRASSSL